MREILFRGKSVDGKSIVGGEWVYGSLIVRSCECDIIDVAQLTHIIPVDPATVGQFTGLYDRNGKRVFEGDIIVRYQVDNDDCPFPNKDTKPRVGRVFFSDYRASFSLAMGLNGSDSLNSDLFRYIRGGGLVEVIGNIYDNPELLEEEEE